jgi:predicted MFS family arabinose efflux permease
MLFGFVDAFFFPAAVALVPEIVPKDDLSSANSLVNLSTQLTGIIGPGVGAVLVEAGGTPLAFALNALSFFISAACLMRLPPLPAPAQEHHHVLREMRDGFLFIVRSPWLWISIAVSAVLNAAGDPAYSVTLPFLVTKLDGGVGSLGIVQTATAIGSVLGAIWLGRYLTLRHRGLLMYGASFVIAVCLVVMGASGSIAGVAGATFVRGACLTATNLVTISAIQAIVPSEKLGRVYSFEVFGSIALMPVGYFVVGWATDHTDPSTIYFVSGALIAVASVLALVHPQVRRFD